jgi:DNA primase small subunit
MASRDFVYAKFCDYYRDSSTIVPAPISFNQREFAYLLFKERYMVRHRRFENIDNFKKELSEIIPSDVYHSCAYYENPDFEMDKKGWIGSDLVFDIDADHIPTLCDKIHDEFTCIKCGFSGNGITPEACPACEGQKFESKTWPCDLCINTARDETAKLINILTEDFGLSYDELHVFFSGHRGYHVHVEDEALRSLDALARKEIIDYVCGFSLSIFEKDTQRKIIKKNGSKRFVLHNYGWNKRLKVGMHDFLLNATKDDLKDIGLRSAALLKNKDLVLRRCINESKWESIPGISVQTWRKIAEYVRDFQSSKVDTVVTTDIHRLIRMNGTLHGKTGLKKIEFPAEKLEDFDPFAEAVAFKKGTAKVLVFNAPEFRISGQTLGPYNNQTVELPVAAAVMLICKGRAEVTP